MSEFIDNKWTSPKNIGSPVNSFTHDACVSLSSDGHKMLIYRTNAALTGGDIYETVKTNLIEWSYPGIDIPYPVYLAHDFSKIRNGCAQKIYDDIISKNLSNKPVGQLFINMLK